MAIQSNSLSAVEHDWYATRSGLPANAPFSEHKRVFLESELGEGNAGLSLTELEKRFLQLDFGLTGENLADLWRQLADLGYVADSNKKSIDQIKYEFFIQNSW